MAPGPHYFPDYRESDGLDLTFERRGKVLRVRAYLTRHGFVALACRHDYPADTVTEDEIINDIAKEFDVGTDRFATERHDPIMASVLTLEMGFGAYGVR
jgi:hypothetical protein